VFRRGVSTLGNTGDQAVEDGHAGAVRTFKAATLTPMAPLTARQYVALSWRKVEISQRHLLELENGLRTAQVIDPPSSTDSRAAIEGHADGCVFQAYAAFDTFACAVATHFDLDRAERASFRSISDRLPSVAAPNDTAEARRVQVAIGTVTQDENWRALSFYRNIAAHRGVVGQRFTFNLDDGFVLRIAELDGPDPDRSEVTTILYRTLGWTAEKVRGLHELAGAW
jgi:hypothetical protein